MNRNDFIKKAQRASYVFKNSINFTKIPWKKTLLVKYKGIFYIPLAYSLEFKKDGNVYHGVKLHDLKANCIVEANLFDVEDVLSNEEEYGISIKQHKTSKDSKTEEKRKRKMICKHCGSKKYIIEKTDKNKNVMICAMCGNFIMNCRKKRKNEINKGIQ